MNACATCRFWSESAARSVDGGALQALCLAPAGAIFAGEWVTARQSCDAHQAGEAVDARVGREVAA